MKSAKTGKVHFRREFRKLWKEAMAGAAIGASGGAISSGLLALTAMQTVVLNGAFVVAGTTLPAFGRWAWRLAKLRRQYANNDWERRNPK